jgi:nucleoside-diphosphate-sugar epimerase
MKVLVTGGNGFIGQHVVAEALARGHDVRLLARTTSGFVDTTIDRPGSLEAVRHDLRHPDGLTKLLADVDAVIHCAASMSGSLEAQRAVTVEGTSHLLSAMKEAGVLHIVGISTFALYDYQRIPTASLLDEDSPLERDFENRSPYVIAKREQEDLVRSTSQANGWRWTILRPGIVFGAGRTWFYQLGTKLNERNWLCFAGESDLPLTYVENCAEAVVGALTADAAVGAVCNIVDDDLPARLDYMRELARWAKPKPRILDIPWRLLEPVSSAVGWTSQKLLRGRIRAPDALRPANTHARCKPLQYANTRAKQLLGWEPRWSFREGLERSAKKRGGSGAL